MKITDYLSELETKEVSAKGMTKKCYYLDNHNLVLLELPPVENTTSLKLDYQKQNEIKKMGVNICETYDIQSIDNKVYILQECAKGNSVHGSNISNINLQEYNSKMLIKISNASQKQFDKYIRDAVLIEKNGLGIDSGRPNLFYSEESGFTFIDLSISSPIEMNKYSRVMFLQCRIGELINYNEKTQTNREMVLNKLAIASVRNGFSIEEIMNAMPEDCNIKIDDLKEIILKENIKSEYEIEREKISADINLVNKLNYVTLMFDKGYNYLFLASEYTRIKEEKIDLFEYGIYDFNSDRLSKLANLYYFYKNQSKEEYNTFIHSDFFKENIYFIYENKNNIFNEALLKLFEDRNRRQLCYHYFIENSKITEEDIQKVKDMKPLKVLYTIEANYDSNFDAFCDNVNYIAALYYISKEDLNLKRELDTVINTFTEEEISYLLHSSNKKVIK